MTIQDNRKERTKSLIEAIKRVNEIDKDILIARASLEMGLTQKKVEEYLKILIIAGYVNQINNKIQNLIFEVVH